MFQLNAKGASSIYGYLSVVGKNRKTINDSNFLREKLSEIEVASLL